MVADVGKPATWPLCERAFKAMLCRPDPVRRRALCRNLFGSSQSDCSENLQKQTTKIHDDFCAKYNFDFRSETPIEGSGRFQWLAGPVADDTCPILRSLTSNAEEPTAPAAAAATDAVAAEGSSAPAASTIQMQAKITDFLKKRKIKVMSGDSSSNSSKRQRQ